MATICEVCENLVKTSETKLISRYRTITITSYTCPTCGDVSITEEEVPNEVSLEDILDG